MIIRPPRGRLPKKPKPQHASVETILARVERGVASSPLCSSLSSSDKEELVSRLTNNAGHYAVTVEIRPQLKRLTNPVRGNKPNVHTQNLLLDCAKAWSDVTGEADSLWSNSQRQESAGVTLARICIGAVKLRGPGQPHRGDLTRQVDEALDLRKFRAK